MGSAVGARERPDSRGRGGSRTKKEDGAPAWTWKGALAVLVIAVAIVVWNYSSPLPTSFGFDFTAAPPRLILRPELRAQVRDFDAIFARLWASKSTHLKYAFDARTVTTRLVEVALPASSTSEDDQPPPAIINFAVQKVEGRRHRPINPVAELHEVVQPFTTDSGAFNFNIKDASEVLFTIDVVRSLPARAEPRHAHDQEEEQQKGWTSELAGVLINSHPFSYGCVVLVVRTDRMLPQVLTQEAIEVGLLLAAQSTEGLHVGYNSLAGGASVNHLHFQGWYFNATPDGQLPVESAPFALLRSSSGLTVSQSQGYPIRSLLFSADAEEAVSPSRLSAAVYSCVDHLLRHNIPHNLIFASGGRKAYVIPRRFATPNEWDQRAGFPEVAGQIVTVSEEAFAGLVSPYRFLEALSLSRGEFADVLAACS